MIENLPNYVSVVFGLTTLVTFVLFYLAIKKSSVGHKVNLIAVIMISWLIIQMIVSLKLYYVNTVGEMPPKFPIVGILPMFILIIALFNTTKGKQFIDSLPLSNLTFLSVIRIPVEIVIFWLFIHKALPEILTFEGRNFDILAGITAPFIAYFGLIKGKLSNKVILGWNIVCLIILTNIVVMALLSFPTQIQELGFDQPNVGFLYFPFFWLPSFIVPVVYFTHFVSIRQLLNSIE